jgi:hypothetical protein
LIAEVPLILSVRIVMSGTSDCPDAPVMFGIVHNQLNIGEIIKQIPVGCEQLD